MAQPGKRAVDLSVDAREFHLVLKQAKAFDKKIYLNLRRDLRKAATESVAEVKAEVVKPPRVVKNAKAGAKVKFSRHELRAKIAKGVKVQIAASDKSKRVGVFIVSRGSDPASKALKRSWDRDGGWRHPVFGTGAWAPQVGRPYFGSVIQKHAPQIETAVKKALADTVNQLPKS